MPCSYLGLMKSQNQEEQVLEDEHREPQRRSAVAWTLATKDHIRHVAAGIFCLLFLLFQEVPLTL